MSQRTTTSSYRVITELIEQLSNPMSEDTANLRQELVDLIESGRHLLIGAKALARFTRPRFTEDTDYAVDLQAYRRVSKWFRERRDRVTYEDLGEAIRCKTLAIDVINAHNNDVLLEVLQHETGLPSAEGLAACKFVAMSSPTRDRADRIQDFADFSRLALLDEFDAQKLLSYMVGPYAEQREETQRLIDDIRAGRPVQF